MPRINSPSEGAQPVNVNRHQGTETDQRDSDAGQEPRERTLSRHQGGHLDALSPRRPTVSTPTGTCAGAPRGTELPSIEAAARVGEAQVAEPTGVRRRRTVLPAPSAQPQANTSTPPEERGAGDATHAEQPGGLAGFARRAGRTAASNLYLAVKVYVGLAAVTTAYRAARHPRDIVERPIGLLNSGWSLSDRVDEHTVAMGRAEVMQQHGSFIPPDSACFEVSPRIVDDLPAWKGGTVARRNQPVGDWRPTDLQLNRFVRHAGGRHTVHHEYLHCFTHDAFMSAISGSPYAETINEALTERFADRLPGHAVGKLSPYDFERLPNGKRWATAAAELERAVGSDTLQRAYFSGDADAIRAVSAAIVDIWPKDVTNAAWRSIRSGDRGEQQRLAECFVGAALLATGKVPPEPAPGSGNNGNWAMDYLPVATFNRISPAQAQALRTQADAMRAQLGTAFDQAFYGFDREAQGQAMAQIRGAIRAAWKPVL